MTGDERMAALTEAAATHAVERHDPHARRRRRAALVAAVVLAASLIGGGVWVAVKLAQLQAQADDNAVIAQRLGAQVEQMGGTPVVQPPAVDDPDPDDADPDDPEIQDSEIQDPEVDDPDPNDPSVPPGSYTWVDGDGRTQSCVRNGGTDNAPHYDCTAEPPPETVPGNRFPIGG